MPGKYRCQKAGKAEEVGEQQAEPFVERLFPTEGSAVASLQLMESAEIIEAVRAEHPQVIAIALACLDRIEQINPVLNGYNPFPYEIVCERYFLLCILKISKPYFKPFHGMVQALILRMHSIWPQV